MRNQDVWVSVLSDNDSTGDLPTGHGWRPLALKALLRLEVAAVFPEPEVRLRPEGLHIVIFRSSQLAWGWKSPPLFPQALSLLRTNPFDTC